MQLVLASTSRYRRALLERLQIPFDVTAPNNVDETPLEDEYPDDLVRRLSRNKARSVAGHYPEGVIIGSDQVAVLDGKIIGKPGNFSTARAQLKQASGRRVAFLTGLALYNVKSARIQTGIVPFVVHFRRLSDRTIERYLRKDEPYDCAGSFKSESLGVTLFERMEGDDPNSLMGLPLILLTRMLENEGFELV
ncbi:MAG: septum formation inhibitor Maf [Magnetococcales bacterium]|nr:septum formation inhibitor Maf [Magnetococcales bacterium]